MLRLIDEDVGHLDPAARPTIALYTTSWCGWCRKTRSLLGELGARFDERDVEQDREAGLQADRLTGGASSCATGLSDDRFGAGQGASSTVANAAASGRGF